MRYLFAFLFSCTFSYAVAQRDTLLGKSGNFSGSLEGVTVKASAAKLREHVAGTQMGKVDLPVSMLIRTPAIGGEPDVIKALQLTPGVKRGTEGGIGMYVRGGGNDENLILLDGAPVYNAGHLLGFFSVFNAAALKDVQLYKSSFPSQYGGRLSSVLDVRTKDGSLTEYSGTASIGLVSSALSVSGPIVKDRLSGMAAVRRTYIDKVFRYLPYHFYDANARLSYVASGKDRLSLSIYSGDDVLKSTTTNVDSGGRENQLKNSMKLGNLTGTLRWSHAASSKGFSSDLSLIYTRFRYNVGGSLGANELAVRSAITDIGIKGDFRWQPRNAHKLGGGFSVVRHYFNPNIVRSSGNDLEQFRSSNGIEITNTETALYLNDVYDINHRWSLNAGIRLSQDFTEGKTYITPEPRIALRYMLGKEQSLKASYARMAQYMHLVSSSSLALPTDLWYPVTANIAPGISDQVSVGYYHTLSDLGISVSAEAYYKQMHNLIEYREGAQLLMNNDYEQELVHGRGRSYGIELFAARTSGRFTGWLGYTLSYTRRQFDSLNGGREYDARYDKRHDFSAVGMYDISKRWAVSSNVLYATGSSFTGQTGQYLMPKPDFTGFEALPAYTSRNALRLSASFRIDLDLQYKFALGRKLRADAHLSVYNLLNRTQPSRVERVWNEQKQTYTYEQKGLFGNITTATLNIHF